MSGTNKSEFISWTCLQGKKYDKSAALFIADTITSNPGNVSVLALGPLTNLAMAFQSSPDVARDIVRTFLPQLSNFPVGVIGILVGLQQECAFSASHNFIAGKFAVSLACFSRATPRQIHVPCHCML